MYSLRTYSWYESKNINLMSYKIIQASTNKQSYSNYQAILRECLFVPAF